MGRVKFPEASPNSLRESPGVIVDFSLPLSESPDSQVDEKLPHPPILWRSKFSEDVASQLVSWSNPDGSVVNNSELELAGVIGQNDILVNCTKTGTNNTAAHSWATKGAVSSTGPSSYFIRLKSMHQRAHCYQLRTFYIPGPINKMADDCSRLWHLSDAELLDIYI